jgi:DNA-binding MarR family transcriptional regulator
MTMPGTEHHDRMTASQDGKASTLIPKVAREAAGSLFELMYSQKSRFENIAAGFGLSMPQAAILWHLNPTLPVAMGSLADEMHCDASNITGMVDKLEHRGLLLRHASKEDRRVKLLALTEGGVQMRTQFLDAVREPAPWLLALNPEDQIMLRDIARRALTHIQKPPTNV